MSLYIGSENMKKARCLHDRRNENKTKNIRVNLKTDSRIIAHFRPKLWTNSIRPYYSPSNIVTDRVNHCLTLTEPRVAQIASLGGSQMEYYLNQSMDWNTG